MNVNYNFFVPSTYFFAVLTDNVYHYHQCHRLVITTVTDLKKLFDTALVQNVLMT